MCPLIVNPLNRARDLLYAHICCFYGSQYCKLLNKAVVESLGTLLSEVHMALGHQVRGHCEGQTLDTNYDKYPNFAAK